MKTRRLWLALKALIRCLLTLTVIVLGVVAARRIWRHYRTEPWTRDGRVNAEIVRIVPEVSGKVCRLPIVDNQVVQKGDVLFVIDPESFRLALEQSEALLVSRQSELALTIDQAERRKRLVEAKAISSEEHHNAVSAVAVAQSAVAAAVAARDLAKLDLDRTVVTSPVNGYVTNLNLRLGDYASSGQQQFAIIDRDSFWVTGYFEETKLPSVHIGDVAHIQLMGGQAPISGRVESISRGISDAAVSGKGLAEVDPVFNWVRLAQRIPVRIHLNDSPADLFLSSGMTCSVQLGEPDQNKKTVFSSKW
jgi:RND family efflux transporter MFP subunit